MANCEICGALPMFKKGDRVALNTVWVTHSQEVGSLGRRATVLGYSRTAQNCIRILFDGQKTPQTYHQSFLRRVRYDR